MERRVSNLLLCPALALTLALAGCGGQSHVASAPLPPAGKPHPPAKPLTKPPTKPLAKPQNTPSKPPEAEVMHLPGLDGVIGARANALVQEFGTPQIDLKEGDVRKLQFAGVPCVLDVYLYPPDKGGEQVATHVEARRASDGLAVDRGQCVAALRKG